VDCEKLALKKKLSLPAASASPQAARDSQQNGTIIWSDHCRAAGDEPLFHQTNPFRVKAKFPHTIEVQPINPLDETSLPIGARSIPDAEGRFEYASRQISRERLTSQIAYQKPHWSPKRKKLRLVSICILRAVQSTNRSFMM
jgi:hypothetical protein